MVNNKKITKEFVVKLIEDNRDILNFGFPGKDPAISDEWILKRERELSRFFSKSYKWFLREYGGGEIGGDEIFSIYARDLNSEALLPGDIVYQKRLDEKLGLIPEEYLVVSRTSYDEIFVFNYSEFKDNECPICLYFPSGVIQPYASDFYEFLYKQIIVNT